MAGLPTASSLTVLMYHRISDHERPDFLTLSYQELLRQFAYLQAEGYQTLLLSELITGLEQNTLPNKALLVTFDDGYLNNLELMIPAAQRFGIKTNIFLVNDFVDQKVAEGGPYLNLSELQSMDQQMVNFGYHSCSHKSYKVLASEAIKADVAQSIMHFQQLNLPIQPALAYPFGAFPKNEPEKYAEMKSILYQAGIKVAFRIGNRINQLPLQDNYLIQRIDVRGNESFLRFKLKLNFGKLF